MKTLSAGVLPSILGQSFHWSSKRNQNYKGYYSFKLGQKREQEARRGQRRNETNAIRIDQRVAIEQPKVVRKLT